MSEELLDALSILVFKNQILSAPMDELKKFYEEEKYFLCFLDSIALVSQREPAFFLLSPEIKNRIIQVLDVHRFSVNEEVLGVINDVVIYLNSMENVSKEMSALIVKSYIDFHEKIRNIKFNDVADFLTALSYDAVFMNALDDDNMQNLTNHKMNMSSFNYLISTSPDFFKNEKIMERANRLLDDEKKDAKVFSKKKKNINNLKKSLDLISKEE